MKKQLFIALIIGSVIAANDTTSLLAQNKRSTNHSHKINTNRRRIPASRFPGQFPESSERVLTAKDVEHQTAWGMRVMMNEIYARHGYIFREKDLRKHFATEKWYKGKERNIRKIELSPLEIQNIAFVKDAQKHPKH